MLKAEHRKLGIKLTAQLLDFCYKKQSSVCRIRYFACQRSWRVWDTELFSHMRNQTQQLRALTQLSAWLALSFIYPKIPVAQNRQRT